MPEQPNEQTKIIERDIQRLREDQQSNAKRFDRHLEIYAQNKQELYGVKNNLEHLNETVKKTQLHISADQSNQWDSIKKLTDAQTDIRLEVGSIATKVAAFATVGSAAASAAVAYLFNIMV